MAQANWVAQEVQPWLAAVEALDRWRVDACARHPDEPTVGELRSLLLLLAQGQVAVPREMPVAGDALTRLFATADTPAKLAAWRARRAALLRLAVWRSLHALHGLHTHDRRPAQPAAPMPGAAHSADAANASRSKPPHEGSAADAMAALQEAMAGAHLRVPPGLAPTLEYAADAKAQQFFDGCVRTILQKLARRHAGHAVWLQRLQAAGNDVGSVAGAQAWSEAWTVGIAANYLNCLQAKSAGRLRRAMVLVWSDKSTRLHAADKLLLLPARERHLHLHL